VTTAALVESLRARGVLLRVVGDRIRYRPASALKADEIETLRRRKAEVLQLLTSRGRYALNFDSVCVAPMPNTRPMTLPVTSGSYSYPWPDALPGLGPRSVGPFDRCVGCKAGSWARYGAVVLCVRCALRQERN
jgi:TubC N-terminal docking domain